MILTLEELDRCATYITRPDLCSVYGLCEYLAALIPPDEDADRGEPGTTGPAQPSTGGTPVIIHLSEFTVADDEELDLEHFRHRLEQALTNAGFSSWRGVLKPALHDADPVPFEGHRPRIEGTDIDERIGHFAPDEAGAQ